MRIVYGDVVIEIETRRGGAGGRTDSRAAALAGIARPTNGTGPDIQLSERALAAKPVTP